MVTYFIHSFTTGKTVHAQAITNGIMPVKPASSLHKNCNIICRAALNVIATTMECLDFYRLKCLIKKPERKKY